MSFVTQEDVFATLEPIMAGVFAEFGGGRRVTEGAFPRIPYDAALLQYGSDKPDLRNPLLITDVTQHFAGSGFGLFARIAGLGRGWCGPVPAPGAGPKPRGFFDKLNEWAREQGAGGPGLHPVRGGRRPRPDRQEPGAGPGGGDPRRLRPATRRRRVLRRRPA